MKSAVCTVISRNYLPLARTLTASFRAFHPEVPVFVLLVDRVEEQFQPQGEEFQLVEVAELAGRIPHLDAVLFKYGIVEANTAVKPYFFEHLFEKYGLDKLLYFDPDILFLHSIEDLFAELDDCQILLTPHMLAPVDDLKEPGEITILRAGTYNLGFLGMAGGDETERMLKWWQRRLYHHCRVDLDGGMHVDQKWMDLVPSFFDGVRVLRKQEYNVAYWNLHERGHAVHQRDDGAWWIGDVPLRFFHFSGFLVDDIDAVSKHQNRYTLEDLPNLRPLFRLYASELTRRGYNTCKSWTYAFGSFDNRVPIPPVVRRLFLSLEPDEAAEFGNPFQANASGRLLTWLEEPVAGGGEQGPAVPRLWKAVYDSRSDVRAAFPRVPGADTPGFFAWIQSSGAVESGITPFFPRPSVDVGRPEGEPQTNGRATGLTRMALVVAGAAGRLPIRLLFPPQSRTRTRLRNLWHRLMDGGSLGYAAARADDLDGSEPLIALDAPAANQVVEMPVMLSGWAYSKKGIDRVDLFANDQLLDTLECGHIRADVAEYLGHPDAADSGFVHLLSDESLPDGEGRIRLVATDMDGDTASIDRVLNLRRATPSAPSASASAQLPEGFGVNLCGYVQSDKGIGEGVRSDFRILEAAGVPCATVGLKDGSDQVDGDGIRSQFAINLLHVNADRLPFLYEQLGGSFFSGRYNIGYWAWELEEFPSRWFSSFKLVDEIWVPSCFVRDSIARVSPVPVISVPHSISMSHVPDYAQAREELGVTADEFVFLFMFDYASSFYRKNPLGLVEAFGRAAPQIENARLVIKSLRGNEYPAEQDQLRRAADRTPGVRLVETSMSREQVDKLVAGSDCYISLHRSEGFGLTVAEAMAMGRPVISTAYSGSMDFTTPENSWLVSHRMTEVGHTHLAYDAHMRWADPDVDHAAELMVAVATNPGEAERRARLGQRTVAETLSPKAIARELNARLESLAAQRKIPRRPEATA